MALSSLSVSYNASNPFKQKIRSTKRLLFVEQHMQQEQLLFEQVWTFESQIDDTIWIDVEREKVKTCNPSNEKMLFSYIKCDTYFCVICKCTKQTLKPALLRQLAIYYCFYSSHHIHVFYSNFEFQRACCCCRHNILNSKTSTVLVHFVFEYTYIYIYSIHHSRAYTFHPSLNANGLKRVHTSNCISCSVVQ